MSTMRKIRRRARQTLGLSYMGFRERKAFRIKARSRSRFRQGWDRFTSSIGSFGQID